MKFVIASDVHGSSYHLKKLFDRFNEEGADKLILLGDIYNHGPRNPLPTEYAPMSVSEMLNGIKDKLIVIKGNCDSQVDTMISEFSFIESAVLVSGGKTVFLTHGHVFNKDSMPSTKFDAIVYGHFHTGFIEKKGETVVANAGSISLPKNGTPNSYIVLEEGELTLKTLDGEAINRIKI
jgi:putative phosphoesterase